MRGKAASSFDDGPCDSSGREPSTTASSIWVAICRKIGPPSSFTPSRRTREEPGGSLVHYSRNEPWNHRAPDRKTSRGRSARRRLPGLLAAGLAGEDQVERPSGVGQHRGGRRELGGVADPAQLVDGAHQLTDGAPQVDAVAVAGERGERIDVAQALDVGATGLGQRDQPPAALGADLDQALVLELRDGGVDRPRREPPAAAGAVGDRLHELVAVHRLLAEQEQQCGADVAATGTAPAATGAAAAAFAAGAARAGAELGPESRRAERGRTESGDAGSLEGAAPEVPAGALGAVGPRVVVRVVPARGLMAALAERSVGAAGPRPRIRGPHGTPPCCSDALTIYRVVSLRKTPTPATAPSHGAASVRSPPGRRSTACTCPRTSRNDCCCPTPPSWPGGGALAA